METDLVTRLRGHARARPDHEALTFIAGDVARRTTYTYAELDRQARAIATAMQEAFPSCEGKRALLVFPPGFEFLAAYLGCLYAGVIAVPTYAPHPAQLRRSLDRFLGIARDAGPEIFLTTGAYALPLRMLMAALPRHWRARCIDTTGLDVEALAARWRPPEIRPETLAFIQYTSGSTSAPKGVMVSHGNLVHNLGAIEKLAAGVPEPRGVSWLPPYHDMGLIGGLLQPLYAGFPALVISPLDFLQRPRLWLEAITWFRATVSPLPNFALELCARKIDSLAGIDLSSWHVAINGAEPIRRDSLERFSARFESVGFRPETHRPVYGLAEATLMVSCRTEREMTPTLEVSRQGIEQGQVAPPREPGDQRALVSCGRSIDGQRIVIVDPETRRRLGAREVGEIWIQGPSVAHGYWKKPEETDRVFHTRLAGAEDEGAFLRTGDLGFLDGNELYVTGRIKDLIIIAGRNHYPQDIELCAERAHAAIRPGNSVAFAVDDEDVGEHVVVLAEVDRERSPEGFVPDEIRTRIASEIRGTLGIQVKEVLLVKRGSLPKTSSGKLQRYRCRQAFQAGDLSSVSG